MMCYTSNWKDKSFIEIIDEIKYFYGEYYEYPEKDHRDLLKFILEVSMDNIKEMTQKHNNYGVTVFMFLDSVMLNVIIDRNEKLEKRTINFKKISEHRFMELKKKRINSGFTGYYDLI